MGCYGAVMFFSLTHRAELEILVPQVLLILTCMYLPMHISFATVPEPSLALSTFLALTRTTEQVSRITQEARLVAHQAPSSSLSVYQHPYRSQLTRHHLHSIISPPVPNTDTPTSRHACCSNHKQTAYGQPHKTPSRHRHRRTRRCPSVHHPQHK